MRNIPEPLEQVINDLRRLGLGPKASLRAAMLLLKWPENESRRLGEDISLLHSRLAPCLRCGALTDQETCQICRDPARDARLLCLTADWDSLLCLEEGGFYRGFYLVMPSLLTPMNKQEPEEPNLEKLEARLEEGVEELILALGATLEAENTASYLRRRIERKFPRLRVSRLAQGIPLGSEVKFMDSETLRQSMRYRQEI